MQGRRAAVAARAARGQAVARDAAPHDDVDAAARRRALVRLGGPTPSRPQWRAAPPAAARPRGHGALLRARGRPAASGLEARGVGHRVGVRTAARVSSPLGSSVGVRCFFARPLLLSTRLAHGSLAAPPAPSQFMSLPQRGYTTGYDPARDDRTLYQLERFGRGLGESMYGTARYTTTLVCDWAMPEAAENAAPIDRRGTRHADASEGLCTPSRPFGRARPRCRPSPAVRGLGPTIPFLSLLLARLVHLRAQAELHAQGQRLLPRAQPGGQRQRALLV